MCKFDRYLNGWLKLDVTFRRLEKNTTKSDCSPQSSIIFGLNSEVQILNRVKVSYNHRIKGK